MTHKLHRLLNSIYNSPQLITAEAFKPIVDYLQERNSISFSFVPEAKSVDSKKKPEKVGGIGEIKIDGAISYLPVEGLCGEATGTSYQGILEQAEELIEMGVDTILMTFSSPGGQAAHCFTTCDELRSMVDEAGINLISYVDEYAASAALALSVIADEVIIHPSASTGSVGCVSCLYDTSKAMASAGVKPIYVSSTPGKTPFQEDGSFSEGFLASVQEDVTRLGNQFATHVSKYTGLKTEDILAMDAKMFHAEKAVEVGLANKVMDHKQFAAYLAEPKGKTHAK
jgi:ClpP class serine protease